MKARRSSKAVLEIRLDASDPRFDRLHVRVGEHEIALHGILERLVDLQDRLEKTSHSELPLWGVGRRT